MAFAFSECLVASGVVETPLISHKDTRSVYAFFSRCCFRKRGINPKRHHLSGLKVTDKNPEKRFKKCI